MCCVQPQALLSALLLRAERDGHTVTEQDWANVLGAGCTAAQIDAALLGRPGPALAEARASWSRLRRRAGR